MQAEPRNGSTPLRFSAFKTSWRERTTFGANLENDLVLVPNKRGEIEFLFDGLYSAKKQSNQ